METVDYCLFEPQHIPLMEPFRDDQNTVYPPEQLLAFLKQSNARAFIAKDRDIVVGFAYGMILPKPDGRRDFYLHAVDVMEAFQGCGHGTKLVDFVSQYSRSIGCEKMFLITDRSNLPACRCYENAGGTPSSSDDIVYTFR